MFYIEFVYGNKKYGKKTKKKFGSEPGFELAPLTSQKMKLEQPTQ